MVRMGDGVDETEVPDYANSVLYNVSVEMGDPEERPVEESKPLVNWENSGEGEELLLIRWPNAAVLLLISLFEKHKDKFRSAYYSNKKVWEIISAEMKGHQHFMTGGQCDSKWRGLKKQYKKIRHRAGNFKKDWPYLKRMEEVLRACGQKVNAVVVQSSSGQRTLGKTDLRDGGAEEEAAGPSGVRPLDVINPRKRKPLDLQDMFRILREDKERRHRERMRLSMRVYKLLKEQCNIPGSSDDSE